MAGGGHRLTWAEAHGRALRQSANAGRVPLALRVTGLDEEGGQMTVKLGHMCALVAGLLLVQALLRAAVTVLLRGAAPPFLLGRGAGWAGLLLVLGIFAYPLSCGARHET